MSWATRTIDMENYIKKGMKRGSKQLTRVLKVSARFNILQLQFKKMKKI